MEFLNSTKGGYEVSPVNSNLVISKETQETIAIVMSGKYNGICFPEKRTEKQDNAKLISRSYDMYEFLKKFYGMLDKLAIGNISYDQDNTIGEIIEKFLRK